MKIENINNIEASFEGEFQQCPVSITYAEMIPPAIIEGLVNYVAHGISPGGFLSAVIENDLAEAFARGDCSSLAALRAIVMWLNNNAPNSCWGFNGAIKDWLNR